MAKICWCVIVLTVCYFSSTTLSQALNSHINPRWVESGRELLARQGGLFDTRTGLQGGLFDTRTGLQGGLLDTRTGLQGGYSPSGTSLFYLDNGGQLRPVYLGNRDPLLGQQQLYSGQGYINGNFGNGRTNLYQGTQNSYIK